MEQKQKPERYRMPAAHSLAPGKVLNYEYLSNRALETISAQLDYGLDRLDYLIEQIVTHWQPLPEPPVAEQEADHD